jgi:hypothetical protein
LLYEATLLFGASFIVGSINTCMMNGEQRLDVTGRGILTEYERECLAGERAKQREYESRSRVRSRIDESVADDVAFLAENEPELLDRLREVVCEDVK